MRSVLLITGLVLILGASSACAEEIGDVRISRPSAGSAERPSTGSAEAPSANSSERSPASSAATAVGTDGHHCGTENNSSFGTAGGAVPICSSDEIADPTRRANHTCCDVTSQYFPITIVGPSQHFGMWLRLNLYPTLCSSILCQRQCAVNGYESCNALGGERNMIQEVIDNAGDCSSGGCCESDRTNTTSEQQNKMLSMQPDDCHR